MIFSNRETACANTLPCRQEKFNVKSDTPPETLLAFYNELYVYLLDLMHRTINEMFARSALTLVGPTPPSRALAEAERHGPFSNRYSGGHQIWMGKNAESHSSLGRRVLKGRERIF